MQQMRHTRFETERPNENESLQPTPGSGFSSAARSTSTGPAWLSLVVSRDVKSHQPLLSVVWS